MLPAPPFLFCDHISCKVLSGAEICLLVTGLRTCCNLKNLKKESKKIGKIRSQKTANLEFCGQHEDEKKGDFLCLVHIMFSI